MAALAFASLLALAVATVGLKTSSLRARARIEALALSVKAQRFEVTHRHRALQQATTRELMAARLRSMLSAMGGGGA